MILSSSAAYCPELEGWGLWVWFTSCSLWLPGSGGLRAVSVNSHRVHLDCRKLEGWGLWVWFTSCSLWLPGSGGLRAVSVNSHRVHLDCRKLEGWGLWVWIHIVYTLIAWVAKWSRVHWEGGVVLCWWLFVPTTGCISGTDLLRQLRMPSYWDRSRRSNFLPHPVTISWHLANQFQRWLFNARRLVGQPVGGQS